MPLPPGNSEDLLTALENQDQPGKCLSLPQRPWTLLWIAPADTTSMVSVPGSQILTFLPQEPIFHFISVLKTRESQR